MLVRSTELYVHSTDGVKSFGGKDQHRRQQSTPYCPFRNLNNSPPNAGLPMSQSPSLPRPAVDRKGGPSPVSGGSMGGPISLLADVALGGRHQPTVSPVDRPHSADLQQPSAIRPRSSRSHHVQDRYSMPPITSPQQDFFSPPIRGGRRSSQLSVSPICFWLTVFSKCRRVPQRPMPSHTVPLTLREATSAPPMHGAIHHTANQSTVLRRQVST